MNLYIPQPFIYKPLLLPNILSSLPSYTTLQGQDRTINQKISCIIVLCFQASGAAVALFPLVGLYCLTRLTGLLIKFGESSFWWCIYLPKTLTRGTG